MPILICCFLLVRNEISEGAYGGTLIGFGPLAARPSEITMEDADLNKFVKEMGKVSRVCTEEELNSRYRVNPASTALVLLLLLLI